MRRFTDSPYESIMQKLPTPGQPTMPKAPAGSPCRGCAYWQGMPCMVVCYRELMENREGAGTSGHFVQKSRPS